MPKYTMSDGRQFTDYRPSCELNRMLQTKYNSPTSYEYRQYLQKNGESIMKDMADCGEDSKCVTCPVCRKQVA